MTHVHDWLSQTPSWLVYLQAHTRFLVRPQLMTRI
jgi:hypothetical protein